VLPKLPRLRSKTHRDGSISYWYDLGGTPRRWRPLGKVEAVVLRQYQDLVARPKPAAGTVDAMLADCLVALEGKVAPGTLANYRGYRKHLSAVFAPDPAQITQADVLKYLRLCPRMTFRNEIGFLSLAFVGWMDAGRLTFNPCFGVRCKRKGSKRTRLLAPAEIDAIVAAADERLAVAVELAFATGLRIGDLCALRWADLSGIIETQKTGARATLEPSDALDVILTRARALQARVASLYVLCDRRGRRWKTKTLRKHWDAAVERAGIADAHFHDLRAAAGTQVARQHGQESARTFLNHRDLRTTLTYLRGLQANVIRPIRRKGTG
jgi:integrase